MLRAGSCLLSRFARRSSTAPHARSLAVSSASAMAQPAPAAATKRKLRGIVFDMDGTVTVPCIDFGEMRARCGVTSGDILDVISSRSKEEQDKAYAIIAEIEEQALRDMKLLPGALELFAYQRSIPRGLITRNVMPSVHHLHNHHLVPNGVSPFQPAISRECEFEYKPSPQALLHICNSWGVSPSEVIMVGDSARDDVVCGNRAGAIAVLLDLNEMHGYEKQNLDGEMRPHYLVRSLFELRDLLESSFELEPPPQHHAAIEGAK